MDAKEYHRQYYHSHREKKLQQSKESRLRHRKQCTCGKLIDYRSQHCKSCAFKIAIRSGERRIGNAVYKGGRREIRGYIKILLPEHPRADKRGYVSEHLLVWEKANNKPLPNGWVVHHLNGIRNDNRPTNLIGLPDKKHRHILAAKARRVQELEAKEREAQAECSKLIAKLNLPMKVITAEYNLDGSRLTFYFSAAQRVDFRELVRELAGCLKVWVEMRQTGPRDEAKLIGGCGRCGRTLCCASFLSEFAPVSIRMAKEQNLPLNPMKISGCCGRLMCCLVYENEQYHTMNRKLPKKGQQVSTAKGVAKVIGGNPLKETVLVKLEDGAAVELPLGDVSY